MKSASIRITKQLLNTHSSNCDLEDVRFLNLTNLRLQSIDRLQHLCPNVQVLFINGNVIQEIHPTFLLLHNIWILDISQNKLRSLDGLDRFIVLGSVNLSRNDLSWKELRKISHITFLSLYLFKNRRLDEDPKYREHIVDLFSKVWFLDGVLITTDERKRVECFFRLESLKLINPVRRKSSRNRRFIPTSQKNILTNGLHGFWTEIFLKKFPLNFIQDSTLDSRRISFLFASLLDCYQLNTVFDLKDQIDSIHGLSSLIDARRKFPESCNMLLLLIIVYILFSLPKLLLLECLVKTDLQRIHDLNCTHLFLTSSCQLLKFISTVLLASILVDKEKGIKSGLYDKLFDAIYLSVYDIFTEKSTITNQNAYYCLLASEVLEPFCLIQEFFELIGENEGVSKLVVVATRDPFILKEIKDIKLSSTGDKWVVYQEISALLLHKSVPNLLHSTSETSYFSLLEFDHMTFTLPLHNLITSNNFPASSLHDFHEGESHLRNTLINKQCSEDFYSIYQNASIIRPGDFVRLHNNKLARVLALTAPDVALLSTTSQSVTEFIYIKTSKLAWDPIGRWTVKKCMKSQFNTTSISSSPTATTFYISRPASSMCESSNYDAAEISNDQLSDSLHCNSLTDANEETNAQVNYQEVMWPKQSLEELRKERKYIQLVINQMHHDIRREFRNSSQHDENFNYNSRFDISHRPLGTLSIDNSITLPSMCYDDIKHRSKCIISSQHSLSDFSRPSRLVSLNKTLPNYSEHTPQCWIEVSYPKEFSSPSICNLGINIDPTNVKPFTKWSPNSSFNRFAYKTKKRSLSLKLSTESKPLLCVIGNNLTIERAHKQ